MAGLGGSRAAPFLPLAVDSILLAGMLFATVAHSGVPVTPASFASAVSHSSVVASEAALAVDPPSYWMRSGTNVTLEAVWTSGSPLCRVTPLWYGWSVDSGNATGFLNNTSGPSTTFIADSFDSGMVRAVARAVAEVDCGANQNRHRPHRRGEPLGRRTDIALRHRVRSEPAPPRRSGKPRRGDRGRRPPLPAGRFLG